MQEYPGSPAMPPEEFRRLGGQVIDWIAGYLDHIRDYPVLPQVRPGELVDRLPSAAPESGEPMERILDDFRSWIVPGVTHWNHPRFLAYFAISGSEPGILAETLSAALNVNGMLWKSCPAATELEQVTLGWLRQWLGLPEEFFGIIYDTASVSSLHAIVAAREQADPDARRRGHRGGLTLYCSELAHSSIEKGAITAGIGQDHVRKIAVDEAFRLRPDLLEQAIEQDLGAGRRPFCLVGTVGTTAVTSIDPIPDMAALAERFGLWLHVDAAYENAAAMLDEYRHVLAGAERADSVVVNPHKWLLTPVDVSAFYTRRPEVLRRAFSLVPEYLKTEDDPRAVNLMDYGVPLGRRFRALKLWFVMRYYGRRGIAAILRSHIALAQEFASWVREDERFEIAAPAPFSLVCFRHKAGDEINRRLLETVNASGLAFLSHTVIGGRLALRLAVGNYRTTRDDLRRVWEFLQQS